MSRTRTIVLLTVLTLCVVVGAGLYFGVMPQRDAHDNHRAARQAAETQNQQLQLQLQSLHADSERLNERRATFARQMQAFPEEPHFDLYLEELDATAEDHGVEVHEVTMEERQLFDPVAAPRGNDPEGTGEDITEQDEAAVPDPQDAVQDPAAGGASPTDLGPEDLAELSGPLQGWELIAVPVHIRAGGAADDVAEFVRTVQQNERYTAVNQFTLTGLDSESPGQDQDDTDDDDADTTVTSGPDVLTGNVEVELTGYIWILSESSS